MTLLFDTFPKSSNKPYLYSLKQRLLNFLSRFQIYLQYNFFTLKKKKTPKKYIFFAFSSNPRKYRLRMPRRQGGGYKQHSSQPEKYRTPCPIQYKNVNQTQPVKAAVLFCCSIPVNFLSFIFS